MISKLIVSDRVSDCIMMLQMCRNMRFTWCGGTLDVKSLLINKPDAPIKLKFESVEKIKSLI